MQAAYSPANGTALQPRQPATPTTPYAPTCTFAPSRRLRHSYRRVAAATRVRSTGSQVWAVPRDSAAVEASTAQHFCRLHDPCAADCVLDSAQRLRLCNSSAGISRRQVLHAVLAFNSAWSCTASPVLAEPAVQPGPLAQRLHQREGALQAPGSAAPWASRTLFYPKWLFGEWDVTCRFAGLQTPLGAKFVPQEWADPGGVGSAVSYRLRFYSTLPDTLQNNLKVQLGLMPSDAIIADRAFNTKATTDAFLGYAAVDSSTYDPRDAPLRQTVTFSAAASDGAVLPPRRAELYLNNLQAEEAVAEDGQEQFYSSELYRQVMLGLRSAATNDYEVLTGFTRTGPARITARQRTALYLHPLDPLYFQAFGRSVALYDYDLELRRMPPPADAGRAVACVPTPKDVIQCI